LSRIIESSGTSESGEFRVYHRSKPPRQSIIYIIKEFSTNQAIQKYVTLAILDGFEMKAEIRQKNPEKSANLLSSFGRETDRADPRFSSGDT
jgi:hypothetical protein